MSGSIEQTDQPLKVTCARCRHMRKRRETQLFSSQDLQSAGILKGKRSGTKSASSGSA